MPPRSAGWAGSGGRELAWRGVRSARGLARGHTRRPPALGWREGCRAPARAPFDASASARLRRLFALSSLFPPHIPSGSRSAGRFRLTTRGLLLPSGTRFFCPCPPFSSARRSLAALPQPGEPLVSAAVANASPRSVGWSQAAAGPGGQAEGRQRGGGRGQGPEAAPGNLLPGPGALFALWCCQSSPPTRRASAGRQAG